MATRQELETLVKSGKLSGDELHVVEQRLKDGDFQPGDRLVLRVPQEQALNDTFTVRTGRMLIIPNFQPIPMQGILRSEAQAYLTKQVARYIRNAEVEVEPLMRISLLGAVNRPGFYTIRADALASEAIMAGGGPSGTADIAKTSIRRNGQEVRSKEEVQAAFARGVSLDELNLQPGDEMVVGERSNLRNNIGLIGAITGAVFAVVAIARLASGN
ncbi:MAG TPA: polysaccharide biosynthesis/export family protein [Gemmatimonadales bacterium]|nr:polysaccharide biosynthesis/export family protein [Gemmatimonadales bacterium]